MQSYVEMDDHAFLDLYGTILLVDCSGSMDSPLNGNSRLDAAMESVKVLLARKRKRYPNDLVGVVGFAEQATELLPIRRASEITENDLPTAESIRTGNLTDVACGLDLAEEKLLRHAPDYLLKVIVGTDGCHNTPADPVATAKRLKENGIHIDVIGVADRDAVDEQQARAIASIGRDGKPCYCFVGDRIGMLRKVEELANHHIKPL